jgi:oligopeptide transport system substrate-binding protein
VRQPARLHVFRSATLATFLVTVLLGCTGGENNVERGNREGVLYLGNGTEPQTIDPHVMSGSPEERVASALFEPLLLRNPFTEAFEAGVAERWEFSDERTTLTFHLNPAARWTTGERVTAEDFRWSWKRMLTPELGSPLADILYVIRGAEAYHKGRATDFDSVGIEVVDSGTLRVELAYPNPFVLENFSYTYLAPVHRATVEAHGGETARFSAWTKPENIVSNGPFRLTDWKLQRYLRVERNPYYWDADRVRLDGIVYRPIESAVTEDRMFRSGQLHATSIVPNNKVPGYRHQPGQPLVETPQMATYYYALNTTIPPLDDRRVRRALALAIDRDAIVSRVLMDTVIAWGAYVPYGMPHYEHPAKLDFDPREARRLLTEAGYPDGRGFPAISLLYNTSEDHRTIAVAVQQMWKEHLNIEITLENQEWQVYLSMARAGNFQIARRGWNGSTNPDSFLYYMTGDSVINNTGFANEAFDELVLGRARETGDVEALMDIYAEAEAILLSEAPIIPIATFTEKRLVQPSVSGMPGRIVSGFNFKYVALDPDAPAWRWHDSEP